VSQAVSINLAACMMLLLLLLGRWSIQNRNRMLTKVELDPTAKTFKSLTCGFIFKLFVAFCMLFFRYSCKSVKI